MKKFILGMTVGLSLILPQTSFADLPNEDLAKFKGFFENYGYVKMCVDQPQTATDIPADKANLNNLPKVVIKNALSRAAKNNEIRQFQESQEVGAGMATFTNCKEVSQNIASGIAILNGYGIFDTEFHKIQAKMSAPKQNVAPVPAGNITQLSQLFALKKTDKLVFNLCDGKGNTPESRCKKLDKQGNNTFKKNGEGYLGQEKKQLTFSWGQEGKVIGLVYTFGDMEGVEANFELKNGTHLIQIPDEGMKKEDCLILQLQK